MRRAALLGCLALMAGCNTYKYFEVHASFDPATLDSSETGYLSSCWITVSGADSSQFRLKGNICPPPATSVAPLDIGTFEFSTFADSGSLTFKFEGFTGMGMMQTCKLAEGTTTIPITGATTIMGNLVATQVGTPCNNGIQPNGGDAGM